jgi:hypothetical protein
MEPRESITERLPSPLRVGQAAVMASTRVICRKNTADAIRDWGGGRAWERLSIYYPLSSPRKICRMARFHLSTFKSERVIPIEG